MQYQVKTIKARNPIDVYCRLKSIHQDNKIGLKQAPLLHLFLQFGCPVECDKIL